MPCLADVMGALSALRRGPASEIAPNSPGNTGRRTPRRYRSPNPTRTTPLSFSRKTTTIQRARAELPTNISTGQRGHGGFEPTPTPPATLPRTGCAEIRVSHDRDNRPIHRRTGRGAVRQRRLHDGV